MFTDENLDYIMERNHGVDNHMMMNRINRDTTAARNWNNMIGRNAMSNHWNVRKQACNCLIINNLQT